MSKVLKVSEDFKIINDSNLIALDSFEDNSIDAIITDPPYELGFLGKKWDSSGIAYNVDLWKKALRVLKPGGFLLAFGGTRTYHRITCAIEDAGFKIRDCIMWLYSSGFPKSHNIGLDIDKINGVESEVIGTTNAPDLQDIGLKQKALGNGHIQSFGQIENAERIQYEIKKARNEWNGWGTSLKPAYEPIIVARKPIKDSVSRNVLKYGVGAINIDECRVGNEKDDDHFGRFPANVIHDGSEEAISGFPITKGSDPSELGDTGFWFGDNRCDKQMSRDYEDEGSASRYFYCAKASKKDREEGLDRFEEKQTTDGYIRSNSESARKFGANSAMRKNIHPTVKPVELMQYLVRLVCPKGSTIVDIFNGSGTTGKAVAYENRERDAHYKYIGIELQEEYCEISVARIDYALNKYEYEAIKEKEEK